MSNHEQPLLSISAELLNMARLDTTASKHTKRDLLALMADSTLSLPITGRGYLGMLHHLKTRGNFTNVFFSLDSSRAHTALLSDLLQDRVSSSWLESLEDTSLPFEDYFDEHFS